MYLQMHLYSNSICLCTCVCNPYVAVAVLYSICGCMRYCVFIHLLTQIQFILISLLYAFIFHFQPYSQFTPKCTSNALIFHLHLHLLSLFIYSLTLSLVIYFSFSFLLLSSSPSHILSIYSSFSLLPSSYPPKPLVHHVHFISHLSMHPCIHVVQ